MIRMRSLKSARRSARVIQGLDRSMVDRPESLKCRPDQSFREPKPEKPEPVKMFHTPLSDLDLMIANGWGDTPQSKLPEDWRTRHK